MLSDVLCLLFTRNLSARVRDQIEAQALFFRSYVVVLSLRICVHTVTSTPVQRGLESQVESCTIQSKI